MEKRSPSALRTRLQAPQQSESGLESTSPASNAPASTTAGANAFTLPIVSGGLRPPPWWAWVAHAGCRGTTMPVTRDSPYTGGCPWPRPRQGSSTRRLPGGARLSGAASGGLPCPPRVATRSAAAPRERACLVHVWSTCHRSRAVPSGLQRHIVRPGRRSYPGETSPRAEP
jgi:hypothetical protein